MLLKSFLTSSTSDCGWFAESGLWPSPWKSSRCLSLFFDRSDSERKWIFGPLDLHQLQPDYIICFVLCGKTKTTWLLNKQTGSPVLNRLTWSSTSTQTSGGNSDFSEELCRAENTFPSPLRKLTAGCKFMACLSVCTETWRGLHPRHGQLCWWTRRWVSAVSWHQSISSITVIVRNWDDLEKIGHRTFHDELDVASKEVFWRPLGKFSTCRTRWRSRGVLDIVHTPAPLLSFSSVVVTVTVLLKVARWKRVPSFSRSIQQIVEKRSQVCWRHPLPLAAILPEHHRLLAKTSHSTLNTEHRASAHLGFRKTFLSVAKRI